MNGWEYLVDTIVIDAEYQKRKGDIDNFHGSDVILSERLNTWGSKGWELVAFLPALPAPELPKNLYVLHAVFKRRESTSP
jgi:hypothetical protein